MISLDTNILYHAWSHVSPVHQHAAEWVSELSQSRQVVISEFVLAEFYVLLRNPRVTLGDPLKGSEAVNVIEKFRSHPRWRLVGFSGNSLKAHNVMWQMAGQENFAYRRLYDLRMAISLMDHGVTHFATCNIKDFQGLGFTKVWNPLHENSGGV